MSYNLKRLSNGQEDIIFSPPLFSYFAPPKADFMTISSIPSKVRYFFKAILQHYVI